MKNLTKNLWNYSVIDIGGTNIRFALFFKSKIVFFKKLNVDRNNYISTLQPVIDWINENKIDILGVSYPGPANYDDGLLVNPPNLPGWHNLDLKNFF